MNKYIGAVIAFGAYLAPVSVPVSSPVQYRNIQTDKAVTYKVASKPGGCGAGSWFREGVFTPDADMKMVAANIR